MAKSLISEAVEAWSGLADFRTERERNKNYTYGRQWEDKILVGNTFIRERDYITAQGQIPLQNNLIRRIVRNVMGVFRRRLAETMEDWSGAARRLAADNSLYELFSRCMEEFLISGMVVAKCRKGKCGMKEGVWCEGISPSSFFFDSNTRDSSGKDANAVGQLHDVSLTDFCDAFVRTEKEYESALRLFGEAGAKGQGETLRVVELWRREKRPIRHKHLWRLRDVWRYYFLTSDGMVVRSGDSPYPHGSHPYIFKAYPFIDGEIHSFVGDMLDQQRYTNRLITMYDWVTRASAKGVLLIPEGAIDGKYIEDVAAQWGKLNGVIVYRHQDGVPEPHQVITQGSHFAISELLDIQLKMLEDVSGVNGALQGNVDNGKISGTLYSQQTENAMTSLSDIMDTFMVFIKEAMDKTTSLMQINETNFVEERK